MWAEVVGLANGEAILTPLGDMRGLSSAAEIVLRSGQDRVPYGDHLLGRVLDARMEPIDGLGPIKRQPDRPLLADSPNPMIRKPIDEVMETGVRAIDSLITLGIGQRLGVFAAVLTGGAAARDVWVGL